MLISPGYGIASLVSNQPFGIVPGYNVQGGDEASWRTVIGNFMYGPTDCWNAQAAFVMWSMSATLGQIFETWFKFNWVGIMGGMVNAIQSKDWNMLANLLGYQAGYVTEAFAIGALVEMVQLLLSPGTAYNGGTQGAGNFNFTDTAAKHMDEAARAVPVQTLSDAISYGKMLPDPQGTSANMFYTTMTRNGKLYNLEVLYDEATNTIMHFEYTPKAIGPLPAIPK